MRVGVNYSGGTVARDLYRIRTSGMDFGDRPNIADFATHWRRHLQADLSQMWRSGISAIRWMVLHGGKLFGFGDASPRLGVSPPNLLEPGVTVTGGRQLKNVNTRALLDSVGDWQFSMPTRVQTRRIVLDFVEMLEIIRRSGTNIRVMPVVLDYRFFMPPPVSQCVNAIQQLNIPDYRVGPLSPAELTEFNRLLLSSGSGCIEGGRAAVLRPSARRAFIDDFLIPLVRAVRDAGLSDRILCWDLGNELDIPLTIDLFAPQGQLAIYREIVPFLRECLEAVALLRVESRACLPESNYPTVPRTVRESPQTTIGWVGYRSVLRHRELRPTFGQFHSYTNGNMNFQRAQSARRRVGMWRLPRAEFLRSQFPVDVIIGEIGTRTDQDPWIDTFATYSPTRAPMPMVVVSPAETFHVDTPRDLPAFVNPVELVPNGYYTYFEFRDNLQNRLVQVAHHRYNWVFLWQWNVSEYMTAGQLIRDANSVKPVDSTYGVGGQQTRVDGFLRALSGPSIDVEKSTDFIRLQTDYRSIDLAVHPYDSRSGS